MLELHGLHHVTSITGDAPLNYRFYTAVLGLRLVKKTVNQDDTSAYHLFYADAEGSPGTDITFFDWPQAAGARPGADRIARTVFRVPGAESLDYWHRRLTKAGVSVDVPVAHMGRQVLNFSDPEGQPLALAPDDGAPEPGVFWPGGGVPEEHAIRGFFAVELEIPRVDQLDPILQQLLGMDRREVDGGVLYAMDGGGPGKEIWTRENPDGDRAVSGRGGVHHVAFRLRDSAEQQQWAARLDAHGVPHSGEIDRFYFRSLYFRISRGILFELATDGPGFAADEDADALGESLALPPFLEPRRKEIESGLTPLDTRKS